MSVWLAKRKEKRDVELGVASQDQSCMVDFVVWIDQQNTGSFFLVIGDH
jgi:hypothetical protein